MRRRLALLLLPAAAGCGAPDPPPPPPPTALVFGAFGDGPYHVWEELRYRALLADIRAVRPAFVVHVGDLHAHPCTPELLEERRQELASLRVPALYTPGDNEWYDCPGRRDAPDEPLAKLAEIRRILFADPQRAHGGAMVVASQGRDPAHAEFVENARWSLGGFIFATVHMIGSANGLEPFRGRTAAYDTASQRRTAAGVAWLRAAFAAARADSAKGVVLFVHANLGLDANGGARRGFEPFVAALRDEVARFDGSVLLVHGDSHEQGMDHPLADGTGRPLPNFTRLETFGSPAIGWVRVVLDTVAGRVLEVEPRLMK